MPLYTLEITVTITTTGTMTVEADTAHAAHAAAAARLDATWRAAPTDWQAELAVLDNAQTVHEHEIAWPDDAGEA